METPPRSESNNKLAIGLAVVITAAWAISFLVDIVVKDYDPSPSVHGLMLLVAGAVFGEGLIKSRSIPPQMTPPPPALEPAKKEGENDG